jgi:hypothetical protein
VPITDTIRQRLGVDLATFSGAQLAGEIPLTDELVNHLIAERLAGHPQVAAVRVHAQEEDTLAVEVVPRARLLPAMRIVARIERQPEFPQQPFLILRWSMPAAGALAMFAAPVVSYFRALPPGIRLDADRIVVDVRELLRSRGFEDVIGFIRRLAVHTRPGALVARFELGV